MKLSLRVIFPQNLCFYRVNLKPWRSCELCWPRTLWGWASCFFSTFLVWLTPKLASAVTSGHSILLIALLFYTAPAAMPNHNAARAVPETSGLCRSLAAEHRTLWSKAWEVHHRNTVLTSLGFPSLDTHLFSFYNCTVDPLTLLFSLFPLGILLLSPLPPSMLVSLDILSGTHNKSLNHTRSAPIACALLHPTTHKSYVHSVDKSPRALTWETLLCRLHRQGFRPWSASRSPRVQGRKAQYHCL